MMGQGEGHRHLHREPASHGPSPASAARRASAMETSAANVRRCRCFSRFALKSVTEIAYTTRARSGDRECAVASEHARPPSCLGFSRSVRRSPSPTLLPGTAPGLSAGTGATPKHAPILIGSAVLSGEPLYLTRRPQRSGYLALAPDPAKAFAARSAQVEAIAATVENRDGRMSNLNAWRAAIGIAAETIWIARQQCVMHGGVAWRVPLAGWRGPYNLDALGNHDRTRAALSALAQAPGTSRRSRTADPAIGPWDADIHARGALRRGCLHFQRGRVEPTTTT